MKIKTIIFDYDGVIHNTFNFHREHVKGFTGVDISEDDFRDIHNGNFFDHKNDELKDVDWLKYRDFIYDSQLKLKTESQIKDTIIALSKEHDLFIVSAGGTKNILDYLEKNGLGGLFKEVIGGDWHSKSKIDKFNFLFEKYSFNPEDCVFITDTLGDILQANELGIKTIAVDFGYHPRETLEKGNPFKIVSSFDQIFEVINGL